MRAGSFASVWTSLNCVAPSGRTARVTVSLWRSIPTNWVSCAMAGPPACDLDRVRERPRSTPRQPQDGQRLSRSHVPTAAAIVSCVSEPLLDTRRSPPLPRPAAIRGRSRAEAPCDCQEAERKQSGDRAETEAEGVGVRDQGADGGRSRARGVDRHEESGADADSSGILSPPRLGRPRGPPTAIPARSDSPREAPRVPGEGAVREGGPPGPARV